MKEKRNEDLYDVKITRVKSAAVKEIDVKTLNLHSGIDYTRKGLQKKLQDLYDTPVSPFMVNSYITAGKLPNKFGGAYVTPALHDDIGIFFLKLSAPLRKL